MQRIVCCLIVLLSLTATAGLVACAGTQTAAKSTALPPTLIPVPAADAWVEFTFPDEGSVLPNPIIVEGRAGPGAQIVRIQIKDTDGTLLGEQVVSFTEPSDRSRGFSVQIYYSAPNQRTPGVIEAYFNEAGQPVKELSVVLSAQ
ncbi:MAG: hypothetical protein ACE5F6_19790 [Anaerolineae bacterium]